MGRPVADRGFACRQREYADVKRVYAVYDSRRAAGIKTRMPVILVARAGLHADDFRCTRLVRGGVFRRLTVRVAMSNRSERSGARQGEHGQVQGKLQRDARHHAWMITAVPEKSANRALEPAVSWQCRGWTLSRASPRRRSIPPLSGQIMPDATGSFCR